MHMQIPKQDYQDQVSIHVLCRVYHKAPHMTSFLFLQDEHSFFIYIGGYSLSLVALFVACAIFFYFKQV